MNIKEFIKQYSAETWDIGFIQNSLDEILQGNEIEVRWMKHKLKDSWFADPFIMDIDDKEIHVLAEEFYKPINRGRIARLIIDRNTLELKHKDVVLEQPTHLSFPAIIRQDGKIYIYPENGESNELNIYEYNPSTNECNKINTIMSGEAYEDSVITEIDGKEYLFCTKQPNPNGNVLNVYCKDNSEKFTHYEDYTFKENVARMAGDFFEYNGKIFRPTQECNIQYGHAVTLQEVTLENGKFSFNEVKRLFSVHPKLTVGMHTFNMYKGMIVTDALGFHNMWIRKILKLFGIIR